MTCLTSLFILSIFSLAGFDKVYAADYKMAENVQANFTFTYRDGVEVYQFPVFKMTSNYVSNGGTTFEIEGIIGKSPLLYKAMDDSYKNRLMTSTGASSFEYNYRFFDVDVDLAREGQTVRTIHYYNCEILNYEALALNSGDYESYTSSKSGFSVVDRIEFRCGGIQSESPKNTKFQNIDYGEIYTFAENVRTFVTFGFDDGEEKIEFTTFELTSGFEESDDAVSPSFSVEGVVNHYPLLYKAIDNSRKVSGLGTASNYDFNALVEFSNGEKILRSLDFRDCRVSGTIINTESDKEEGFTGKSGFAIVNEIDFDCAGLKPINPQYSKIYGESPTWQTFFVENVQPNDRLLMGGGPKIMTTFTFNNGVEKLQFPIFRQGDVLSRANPTFELQGVVGDYPLLYKRVDENMKLQSVSGANLMTELFDVDVNLVHEEMVRGFNYSNCRVVDYHIGSAMNKEENYIKGLFVLENTFSFECQGYHPNNPMYDMMFKTHTKANTQSTTDLRNTSSWGPGFTMEN